MGTTTITATHPGTGVNGSTAFDVLIGISFVGADSASSPAALDLDVGTPAGTLPGDVLVAAIGTRPDGASITPPAGWTFVRRMDNPSGASSSLAVYRRIAVAREPALHRWSFSASTGSVGAIAALRGADVTAPVDVEGGQPTASGLTHDAPSVTTTRNGTMLVTVHTFSSAATWTPPAGMVEAVDLASVTAPAPSGISLELNYALQGFAGVTGTKTATASGNADAGNAHALALSPGP
jgi:MSHA biogenesis protein MshQ